MKKLILLLATLSTVGSLTGCAYLAENQKIQDKINQEPTDCSKSEHRMRPGCSSGD